MKSKNLHVGKALTEEGTRWSGLRPWVPPTAWALVLSALSALPGGRLPQSVWLAFRHSDKLVHGLAYSLLGALIARGLIVGPRGIAHWGIALFTTVVGLGYGLLDEFHQSFVPGRDADLSDVLADMTGALIGAVVLLCTHRIRSRKVQR